MLRGFFAFRVLYFSLDSIKTSNISFVRSVEFMDFLSCDNVDLNLGMCRYCFVS